MSQVWPSRTSRALPGAGAVCSTRSSLGPGSSFSCGAERRSLVSALFAGKPFCVTQDGGGVSQKRPQESHNLTQRAPKADRACDMVIWSFVF